MSNAFDLEASYAAEAREQRKAKFLDTVREVGRVKDAYALARTPRGTVRGWKASDSAFNAALVQARQSSKRPAVIVDSAERKAALIAEIRAGRRINAACRAAKVPRRTAHHWQKTDSQFRGELAAARRPTERETQILRLIAAGHTNRQIGIELHLSLSAVSGHITSLLRRRNVQCRAQLAIEAVRVGAIVVEVTA